ncbi:RtcB family protein [Aquicella lusitana]|uniref:tRNA-splicing ligase RtcB n=1 Tax=Aquicella lusitana TaxID=254246 RepID=A0A370GUH3_9COXI|nr:RtcB family protein [Aquicella lusitana]RDI46886.1 tRNA-splicing ligase RtcB [Aquicella lusitana]VVC73777.1 RNA-splicing ligase RtcB [Aquicella lusitana]
MDMTDIKPLDPYRWTITSTPKPVILYGNKALIEEMDEKVREQIVNVTKLPGLVGAAMTMPDAHWGYGFPIGGVAAFDPDEGGIISAGGVGFDISCGVRCLRTNVFINDVSGHLLQIVDALFNTVPAGVGSEGEIRLSMTEINKVMTGGAEWALRKGYGVREDLNYVEEKGCMADAEPDNVSDQAKKRQLGEMGTLGSGNHYLEVEVVEKIYDAEAARAFGISEGQIIIAIHCGSRGLGHQIGSDYLVALAKAAGRLGIHLPDRELACAPILSEEGQRYIGAMRAGINCALANRQIITHLTREAMSSIIPDIHIETLYDVSHNTCKQEKHRVDNKERELFVHRKGATRALPPGHMLLPERYKQTGQPVFIGGSMGTGSYLLAGNPVEQNQAFSSASHGAGRKMSRHQALKQWHGRQLIDELERQKIYIRSKTMRGVAEEAPGAYKDVDEVAEATEKGGLARRVAFLRPLACIKG